LFYSDPIAGNKRIVSNASGLIGKRIIPGLLYVDAGGAKGIPRSKMTGLLFLLAFL
jgi:hypothetical protein